MSVRSVVLASAVCALAGAALAPVPAAQPALSWERVGTEVHDASDSPARFTPDGTLWVRASEPTGSGVFRLAPPYDSISVWERVRVDTHRVFDASPRYAYAVGTDTVLAVDRGQVLRSTDGGATWPLTQDGGAPRFNGVAEVPAGLPHAGRLLAPDMSVVGWYSDDRGATWALIPRDAPGGTLADSAGIARFAFVTAGPNVGRVVAASSWGIMISDDGGVTWAPTAEWEYFEQTADCVATLRGVAPGGGDRLVTAINDPSVPTAEVYVALSDDGGDAWRRVGGLDPGVFGSCTEAVDLGDGRALLLMKRGPVYGTEDGGETWARWSDFPGGPDDIFARWAVVGPDGRLYVGLGRRGGDLAWVIRSSSPVASWAVSGEGGPAERASDLSLEIHPNPTAGRVTVELSGPPVGRVRLAVYDVRGREIAVLYDGPSSGRRRFGLDSSGLAPGPYVVRATSGRAVVAASVVVVE